MLVIFAAMRPATGEDVALVLLELSTVAMAIFLESFAGARPAYVHAVMALERAGWHGSKKLTVPNNVSLAPLPSRWEDLRFLAQAGTRRLLEVGSKEIAHKIRIK